MNKRRLQFLSSLIVTALIVTLGAVAVAVASGRIRTALERQIASDNGIISQNLRILIRQATREFSNRKDAVDRIQHILEEMHVQGWRGFACVVDEDGRVLAHPEPAMRGHEVPLRTYAPTELGLPVEGPPQTLIGPESRDPAVYRTDADIIAIQWLPDLMTYLCVHQPQEEVTARLSTLFGIVGRIGGVFLVLAASGSWFLVGLLVDRYETRLSRSEARSRALVENSDPIWVADLEGRILEANPAGAALIGAPASSLRGRPISDFWPPEDHPRLQQILTGAGRGDTHEDLAVRTADARIVPVAVRACRIDYGSNEAVYLLLRDVTESVRARNEILEANERLRDLDRLKTDFLNTVSHELRTPLTSIKWSAESLAALGGTGDEATFDKLLGIIRDDNQRLSRLIEQLLSFSRIDAGKLQPRFEHTDLDALLHRAVDESTGAAERKGLRLAAPSTSARIEADAEQLRQVFTNLLDNAIKYTPRGGRIEIGVTQAADSVTVSVTDTGIGIPGEEHGRIFERFYRVDHEAVRHESGTGLGLAIVAGIVRAHGGEVTVESRLGHGTAFHVRLPLTPHAPVPDPSGHGRPAPDGPRQR